MPEQKLFEPESISANALKALLRAKIGGTADTSSLLATMTAAMSAVPPFASMLGNLPTPIDIAAKFGLLSAAGFGAFRLGKEALSDYRKQFVLKSTCDTESSDLLERSLDRSGLLLGYTTDTGEPLYLSDDNMTRHGLITGQTGMGKTVFGNNLMFQQIERGGGLLFVDGKLDADNIQTIYEFCCHAGRKSDFLVINPGQPERSNTYNPILYGDPDEISSRILSLIPDTSGSAGADHYKQSANQALSAFIGGLKEAGLDYNFLSLSMLTMNEPALESLMAMIQSFSPGSPARKNLAMFLDQYSKDNITDSDSTNIHIDLKKLKDTLGGIGSRMHLFGTGKFGDVLNSFNPEVKLYEGIRDNKIMYAALPTMGKAVAAENFGKMMVADLRTSISWLQLNKNDRPKIPFLAFLDELNSYATESLAVMNEQARSARVAIFGAIQTDSGLAKISEDFKERVLANSETKVFFKLSSDDTALSAESIVGMTRRVVTSESAGQTQASSAQSLQVGPQKNSSAGESNQVADREEEQPYVSRDKFKGLDAGECIVVRGRHVWNIRVPFLELSTEIRKSIGPMQINHVKQYKTPNHRGELNKNFDPMSNVDKYLAQSRERRLVKRKEKGGPRNSGNAQNQPPANAASKQLDLLTGEVDATVAADAIPVDATSQTATATPIQKETRQPIFATEGTAPANNESGDEEASDVDGAI